MKILQDSCIKNGPLCVGLDTDPSYIPPEILGIYPSVSQAVLDYNLGIIEGIKNKVGCCKVQIAYYEAMGIDGLAVYAKTLQAVKNAGLPVIADIKRGDIADTAKAYARAHFTGTFEADIITVNPYMGFDTLEPFTHYVRENKKGYFVLLRTSNPGMVDLEKQELKNGGIVLDRVGAELNRLQRLFTQEAEKTNSANLFSCSPIGAVVGCTEESDARQLRDAYPNIFFLIPGYGAQGGAARIAATLLDKAGGTVNSSRGILTAWKNCDAKKNYAIVEKREAKKLQMTDIVECAVAAAAEATSDLLQAKKDVFKN